MTTYQIPLIEGPQVFTITLGKTTYGFRLRYCDTPQGGYILDISDENRQPLVCGIPLVTGCDLLEQYQYLGIPGSLYCATDADPPEAPHHDGLGTSSHLYFEPSQ